MRFADGYYNRTSYIVGRGRVEQKKRKGYKGRLMWVDHQCSRIRETWEVTDAVAICLIQQHTRTFQSFPSAAADGFAPRCGR